jgi:hypothetical protein
MPCILDESGQVVWSACPHTHGNGLKLMEHSYVGNRFVAMVEQKLLSRSQRLVWAGDYADNDTSADKNLFTIATEKEAKEETKAKYEAKEDTEAKENTIQYLVNHDKKQIVDLNTFIKKVHPLPILTAEGNGRGGGDYVGRGPVGEWARDHISTENDASIQSYMANKEFSLLIPYFVE